MAIHPKIVNIIHNDSEMHRYALSLGPRIIKPRMTMDQIPKSGIGLAPRADFVRPEYTPCEMKQFCKTF